MKREVIKTTAQLKELRKELGERLPEGFFLSAIVTQNEETLMGVSIISGKANELAGAINAGLNDSPQLRTELMNAIVGGMMSKTEHNIQAFLSEDNAAEGG